MKLLLKTILTFLFIVGLNIPSVYAQLGFCTGNSGDPIFFENFGSGTTYGPALPAGTTTYNFVNTSGPQDGQYTIGSSTMSYGWRLPSDHTPDDINGKCLIVNANFTPGEFYKTAITGLCESTTYEFSAWLINILPSSGCDGSGIPVNVKFEIWDDSDTNLLASGDTDDIFGSSTPSWQQYGLIFQSLSGQTSIILKMLNNGVGGCGNDLAIDDIVFKSCGDKVELENNSGENRFEACEDDMIKSVPLGATPDFSVFSTHAYQWQVSTDNAVWNDIPGATNNTYIAPAPEPFGAFYYRVKFAETASNLQNPSCNSLSEIFEIKINELQSPFFDALPPICNGDSFALPPTSTNGISGNWSPALNNTSTTTYTFTPAAGQCATTQTLTVVVKQPLTPSFNVIGPICNGDTINLPTTSTNNINGTWSPAPNNTMTTTYNFTPSSGECATTTTLTVVVNQTVTPTFNAVPPVCSGGSISALPTTSINNITGTWSPVIDNAATTTYTFIPSVGQCATTQTLTIVVNQLTTPTFNAVPAICNGDTIMALPTTSTNNISGTWSPVLNNTTTTTYTFTPNAGQCATTQTLIIVVNPVVTPNFNSVAPICSGETLTPLPTTSLNAVAGTWSPALNNTSTTTYTFSPTPGQCATSQTLTIVVNQSVTPTFDPVPAICSGDTLSPLPTLSTNNISGTWSPALDNTTTTSYTFTPTTGECPILSTLTIVVNPNPLIDLDEVYAICTNTNGTEAFQSSILSTKLSETDYSFEWTNASGDIVSTDSSYIPLEGGIYSVFVTDLITGCQNQDSTTVVESGPPTLELILTSNPFAGNGEIEVASSGVGFYEYSLDNGPWQDSPIFTNVSAGNHSTSARDKNGCGFTSIDVCLIGAPKFFTPNGDGINETWSLKGAFCLDYANIYVFDRYGKLLKEFDLNNTGWNGTFNGELLPTNDYWFVIRYREINSNTEKEHKGHFTLKR